MIVAMQEQGHRRADRFRDRGNGGSRSRCAPDHRRNPNHFGWRGSNGQHRPEQIRSLPGVLHVHRISSPYKLAGRGFRPEGTVIEFANGVKLGGKQVVVMAGPCSIENEGQIFETAKRVKASGGASFAEEPSSRAVRPIPSRGWEFRGSKLMFDAAGANGLLVVSEVMEIAQIEPMLPYVDCFQVGARNMQNFNLLRELGRRASRYC